MLLNNCELSPAVVQVVDDPKKLGRIKCIIPGILDNSTMSEENLPWAYPFCMNNYQSFSKPIKGQKIWVLINKQNYNEYWYLPFFEYNEKTKEYVESVYDKNPDVIISRHNGDAASLMTYDEENGFSTRIGDNHINLMQDSHIELLGGEGQLDIDGANVKIGSTADDYKHITMYEPLEEIFKNLNEAFLDLAAKCTVSPLTPLSVGFQKAAKACLEISNAKTKNTRTN